MNIRTHWDTIPHGFQCPHGERIEMRHRAVLKKDGTRILVADVKKPTWDIIQSHKEECLIENILKRCLEGDMAALEAVKGTYTDITNAPSSLAEAQQIVIRMKQEWDKLPKDVRKEFDYNVEKYIAEFGSEEWAEKTGVKALIEKEQAKEKAAKEFDEKVHAAIENLANNTPVGNAGKEE